jgi:hypothetical protein
MLQSSSSTVNSIQRRHCRPPIARLRRLRLREDGLIQSRRLSTSRLRKRANGERLDLAIGLLSLAQAYESIGNSTAASGCLAEAERTATQLGDDVLRQLVDDQRLIARVRRELLPDDLGALREVRQRYKSEGRIEDGARLAVEEGAILIGLGDHDDAIPLLREARATFLDVGDRYWPAPGSEDTRLS